MSKGKSDNSKDSRTANHKDNNKTQKSSVKKADLKHKTEKKVKKEKVDVVSLPAVGMRNYYLFWLLCALVAVALLYVLRGVLLPFALGMVIAYFLDPVADKFEAKGISRTLSTVIVMIGCSIVLLLGFVAFIPALKDQMVELSSSLPIYAESLWSKLDPLLEKASAKVSPEYMQKITAYVQEFSSTAAAWGVGFLKGILSNSMAIISLLSMIVVTPIVVFYFLRDWDKMVDTIDDYLPRRHVGVIREQFKNIDEILSCFIRGQALVCLLLGTFYAVGLSLVGLNAGLVVGVIAGLISFIPYVGSIVGVALGIVLAAAQFGELTPILMVIGVFGVGQFIEGNILTPKLVGESVGLHALWVMFALLAGGALFGFLGLLIAVPVAAVTGVLVRFSLSRYRESSLYNDKTE
ncbi:MAG: AI-2E family transporter [Alphaproteobacteria bacterium]|nr:AI-2E family transporter [Alphaproteobacteria bacterium]